MDHAELAAELESAWESATPIRPFSERVPSFGVDDAYAVQRAWTRQRLTSGELIVGRKIGLTSKAVQEQMGVHEPDYGTLWASRHIPVIANRGRTKLGQFISPRVEGELAFLLHSVPSGSTVTTEDVLAATAAIAPAIEVVDSRIEDWRIELVDTIADNASYGGFCLGTWNADLPAADLASIGMKLSADGEAEVEGIGAAALGHPAAAVAWLLRKLHDLGVDVREGDVILSGALASTIAIEAAATARLEIEGQDPLLLDFVV